MPGATRPSLSRAATPGKNGDEFLCSPKRIGTLQKISDKLEKDAYFQQPVHKRLSEPRHRRMSRKDFKLLEPVSSAEQLVPAIDPQTPFLAETMSVFRRRLPESVLEPEYFTASVSKCNLPLEASVSHRSSRALPWAPSNARERAVLEQLLQERAELSLSMRLEESRRPLVPRTLSRTPTWSSSQLGLYKDWPKGLGRPEEASKLHGLGTQGAFSGDGTASKRVLHGYDGLSASMSASQFQAPLY
mmetsp:Transcript_13077/g.33531  ORF Transcript_13077/g.33531 Transcript_13077/m.33531 type:complete len:245 (-) Transcript_13077:210-944(-)